MVVKDYDNGACHIKINDEYCKDVTKEQIDKIVSKMEHICLESELKREQNSSSTGFM